MLILRQITVDKDAREFIAKIIAGLGKAILTVGFASSFFEKLPLSLRISFSIFGVGLIILSVIVYSWKGEKT